MIIMEVNEVFKYVTDLDAEKKDAPIDKLLKINLLQGHMLQYALAMSDRPISQLMLLEAGQVAALVDFSQTMTAIYTEVMKERLEILRSNTVGGDVLDIFVKGNMKKMSKDLLLSLYEGQDYLGSIMEFMGVVDAYLHNNVGL